jgi:hypothetical protein
MTDRPAEPDEPTTLLEQIVSLERQLAGAVEALRKYGGHHITCTWWMTSADASERECSCGLIDAIGGR